MSCTGDEFFPSSESLTEAQEVLSRERARAAEDAERAAAAAAAVIASGKETAASRLSSALVEFAAKARGGLDPTLWVVPLPNWFSGQNYGIDQLLSRIDVHVPQKPVDKRAGKSYMRQRLFGQSYYDAAESNADYADWLELERARNAAGYEATQNPAYAGIMLLCTPLEMQSIDPMRGDSRNITGQIAARLVFTRTGYYWTSVDWFEWTEATDSETSFTPAGYVTRASYAGYRMPEDAEALAVHLAEHHIRWSVDTDAVDAAGILVRKMASAAHWL